MYKLLHVQRKRVFTVRLSPCWEDTVLHTSVLRVDSIGKAGVATCYNSCVLYVSVPGSVWSPSACAELLAMKNKERIDRYRPKLRRYMLLVYESFGVRACGLRGVLECPLVCPLPCTVTNSRG